VAALSQDKDRSTKLLILVVAMSRHPEKETLRWWCVLWSWPRQLLCTSTSAQSAGTCTPIDCVHCPCLVVLLCVSRQQVDVAQSWAAAGVWGEPRPGPTLRALATPGSGLCGMMASTATPARMHSTPNRRLLRRHTGKPCGQNHMPAAQ